MQIFIINNPLETASVLDKRRFNAQIREAKIILNWCKMIKNGEGKRWVNQPLAKMYIDHIEWLENYIKVFECIRDNDIEKATGCNLRAISLTPSWHTKSYYDQMRRRLYTKNPVFYQRWKGYGESYDNWYWVDGIWKKYPQK